MRRLPPWDLRYGLYLTALLAALQWGLYLLAGDGAPALIWLPLLGLAINVANLLFLKRPFMPYDRILSAFSTDGLRWQKEPGVRLDVGGLHRSRQVYSPCVVAAEAGWRMFYRGGGYNSVILSALPTHQHGSMAGLIVVFSALGGTTGSIITGFLFEAVGGEKAFYFSLLPIAAVLFTLYLFNRRTEEHEFTQPPHSAAH